MGENVYIWDLKDFDVTTNFQGKFVALKKCCMNGIMKFTWVFFLASKDETSGILKNFISEIENLVDKKVKIIRCDNGTEFKNRVMNEFCEKKGIKRELSVARTPQQNSVAEKRNRTLIEAARTMLADSKLPTTFWAEAVNNACYVHIWKLSGRFFLNEYLPDQRAILMVFEDNSKMITSILHHHNTTFISSPPLPYPSLSTIPTSPSSSPSLRHHLAAAATTSTPTTTSTVTTLPLRCPYTSSPPSTPPPSPPQQPSPSLPRYHLLNNTRGVF
ncbi:putative ribonuclease H-like domain-containing protein [Tanacetum coccineum]|uniref:Ribonuclease H-like domain-containing protein n=1 Tax=Tanacetum coccineum TaxID=301880 RepID=A0ABQ4YC61_9ASTR